MKTALPPILAIVILAILPLSAANHPATIVRYHLELRDFSTDQRYDADLTADPDVSWAWDHFSVRPGETKDVQLTPTASTMHIQVDWVVQPTCCPNQHYSGVANLYPQTPLGTITLPPIDTGYGVEVVITLKGVLKANLSIEGQGSVSPPTIQWDAYESRTTTLYADAAATASTMTAQAPTTYDLQGTITFRPVGAQSGGYTTPPKTLKDSPGNSIILRDWTITQPSSTPTGSSTTSPTSASASTTTPAGSSLSTGSSPPTSSRPISPATAASPTTAASSNEGGSELTTATDSPGVSEDSPNPAILGSDSEVLAPADSDSTAAPSAVSASGPLVPVLATLLAVGTLVCRKRT